MELSEKQFGNGGIKDKPDSRDYQYSEIAMGSMPFDWNTPFDIESKIGLIPIKNQYTSFSCGGQAWSYYSYVLDPTNREEKSAKFIYSQTHVGTGGSDGRTNCDLCAKKGVSSETLCPSYLPDKTTNESFMIRSIDINAQAWADATTNREKSYLAVNVDIDSVAQAIRDNNGVVLGVSGKNNGTWLSPFPKPPDKLGPDCWAHWLYAGKVKTIDGKKYIGVLNSWGPFVGEQGWQWLSEDYFKQIFIWACWTMIYLDSIPYVFTKTLRKGDTGFEVRMLQAKLGIFVDGNFGSNTKKAVIAFQLTHLLTPDGVVGPKTNAKLNL